VQDIVADRDAGLASIATVMGAAWTVRFAIACYALAGGLLAVSPGYAPWVAPVSLIYVVAVSPWWNVSDANAENANRGWRRFLALNFIAGIAVTLALLTYFADK
jgi:4-hydroxybenzoate polyprenyltransferase